MLPRSRYRRSRTRRRPRHPRAQPRSLRDVVTSTLASRSASPESGASSSRPAAHPRDERSSSRRRPARSCASSPTRTSPVTALDLSLPLPSPRDSASAVRRREGRGHGTGGSINTAFITAAAEAAGRYHLGQGRRSRAAGVDGHQHAHETDREANAFTLARMLVPASDMGLGERFKRIQEATDAARRRARQASTHSRA